MKKTQLLIVFIILLSAVVLWFVVFRNKGKASKDHDTVLQNISQHSNVFNRSMLHMMDIYYQLTEGFVNWDTSDVMKFSTEMQYAIDSLQIGELKKDSLVYEKALPGIEKVKNEMENINRATTLDEKRVSLNLMSQKLFDFLVTIHYDVNKVYYQECPMAFDDIHSGFWLSNSDAVRNPYLGTKHPKV